ncbi:MAG: cation diffusion facilitator family transporter [Deltaproteobacteria bacterium]|nr:cation diffusion facilitator family transporter [Deltaproteobacteria bacterium]
MKNDLSAQDFKARQKLVQFGLFATLGSLIPTGYAAYISNSVTLLTDLLRCFAEFFAIFISWLVIRKISNEDKSSYNYGFGKLEQFASLAVALALFSTFLISFFSGVERLFEPEKLDNSFFGFVFAIFSVIGNSILWFKNYYYFLNDPSPVVDSQWRLFRAKAFATFVVAISLGLGLIWGSNGWTIYADPVGSLLLSMFLLFSAITLISNSMSDLIDRTIKEELQLIVLKCLISHEDSYRGLDHIRSRKSGNRIFIDLFLEFNPADTIADLKNVSDKITKDLLNHIPNAEITVVSVVKK